MAEAYIVGAVRTAGARRNGQLACWHPADMGGEVINALLERSGIDPAAVDDVIIGCVTQAGEQSFAFARNVVLASSLPQSVPAVTIDRQCGSSQQAVHFAAQAVMSGVQDVVIAGGVESMSRVPMFSNLSFHEREGLGVGPFSERIKKRFGVETFSQFEGAEMLAQKYGFDRETLDRYALQSHQRASHATTSGVFQDEIVPLATDTGLHCRDEGIRHDATLEGISSVRLIREGGVISAANASQICDGASALLIVSERALKEHNLIPLARIVSMAVTAGDPVIMLEEPIQASRRALQRAGLSIADIDLYEINEAFAPVPLAWLQALEANPDQLNVNGGAIALGHPLGATGTKLMTTLLHSLKARGLRYGLQAICEGGGVANATIVEVL
ncbi:MULTISPECIES: acetyl-CoA C-acetyltransferase [unclassified Pseudomonas]|uniref:acetyl-CoA C-acetyltransferase n=1 Tax=unclassified Pseudomonas TaxID=196821 RepID=UPI00245602F7|nr:MULTISPECIES: acetyl-CoA C-acetyltransferase [unclassified Pseudomonas]MDH4561240.1 acetyl-CoA C-acyltransferase [Pseudomonas sp. BN411]MDH4656968.1 acetyl-CoA C-acyltransferase [Pseudomonas sp. BN606]